MVCVLAAHSTSGSMKVLVSARTLQVLDNPNRSRVPSANRRGSLARADRKPEAFSVRMEASVLVNQPAKLLQPLASWWCVGTSDAAPLRREQGVAASYDRLRPTCWLRFWIHQGSRYRKPTNCPGGAESPVACHAGKLRGDPIAALINAAHGSAREVARRSNGPSRIGR